MVDVEGKFAQQLNSLLIDLGSNHNYVHPRIVESFSLRKVKHDKPWLVQLTTWTKRKASEVVMECLIELGRHPSQVNLSILPWGSYDALTNMDWLQEHKTKLDYYNKMLEHLNNKGISEIIKGKSKQTFVIEISYLQLEKYYKRNYQIYAIHVSDTA